MGFHSSVLKSGPCKWDIFQEALNDGERLSHVREGECKVRSVCSGFGTRFLAGGIG